MRLLSARVSRFPGLRSTLIRGLRQLVAGIVDDIPGWARRQLRRIQNGKLVGKEDDNDEEKELTEPGEEKAAIGEDADWRFSGERFGGALEREGNRALELLPWRRPVDQKARRIGPLGGNDFGTGIDFDHCS